MATAAEWMHPYARQADADFERFQVMQSDPAVESCHRLQYLQMACEKVVKAHLCGEGWDPAILRSSHAYIARWLPVVVRQTALALRFSGKQARAVLRHTNQLAGEIELLAPAVKRSGQRPDNCKYPWEDAAGDLHVPLDWTFIPAQLLVIPAGLLFLKLVRAAIDHLLP